MQETGGALFPRYGGQSRAPQGRETVKSAVKLPTKYSTVHYTLSTEHVYKVFFLRMKLYSHSCCVNIKLDFETIWVNKVQ